MSTSEIDVCIGISVEAPAAPEVSTDPETTPAKRKGRPPKHGDRAATAAERQRASRAQKKANLEAQATPQPPPADCTDKRAWSRYLDSIGLSMERGKAMPDAERGAGRLVPSGGASDMDKIDSEHHLDVTGQFDEDIHSDNCLAPAQRRVRPAGSGPSD